ncbi:MAG TPA: M23 family metallopeptidase [Oculatellaceae cyanobacterium]
MNSLPKAASLSLVLLLATAISGNAGSETLTKQPELSSEKRDADVSELRKRQLLFPIENFDVEGIKGSFNQMRGSYRHNASDIAAPRNTEIHAVDDGTIAKLFLSKHGGITIYQFDRSKKFVYYYAHLEKYAPGLADNQEVRKGQVLGFVGTSGDAPANSPHLHFEITLTGPNNQWWHAEPIDPFLVFKK